MNGPRSIPWIKVYTELVHHRKVRKLKAQTGLSHIESLGVMVALWTWYGADFPEGVCPVDEFDPSLIFEVAEDRAETIANGLLKAGLLEHRGDSVAVHDWREYAGVILEKREAQREKDQAKREEAQGKTPRPGAETPPSGAEDHDSGAEPKQSRGKESSGEEEKNREEKTNLTPAVSPRGLDLPSGPSDTLGGGDVFSFPPGNEKASAGVTPLKGISQSTDLAHELCGRWYELLKSNSVPEIASLTRYKYLTRDVAFWREALSNGTLSVDDLEYLIEELNRRPNHRFWHYAHSGEYLFKGGGWQMMLSAMPGEEEEEVTF